MSLVTLGHGGLPVQISPVLPQTPPPSLVQAPLPQPPTAIAKLERQASGSETRHGGGSHTASNRGRVLDVKA